MLDPKINTFLILASCKSTTKCAKILNITQPAVSQHIKALESIYGVKFFIKEGRRLILTEKGIRFEQLCKRLYTMDEQITKEMQKEGKPSMHFGATLSIADGLMPKILPKLIDEFKDIQFHMAQQNTATLLNQLENGILDFALVEGNFDHKKYTYYPFYKSAFVGLCKPESEFSTFKSIAETLTAPLILREKGSGTRDIFENECNVNNIKLSDFSAVYEIENVSTLLSLVSAGKGITFAYEVAGRQLLKNGQLSIIPLEDFKLERPFHFVFLPDNPRINLLNRLYEKIKYIAKNE